MEDAYILMGIIKASDGAKLTLAILLTSGFQSMLPEIAGAGGRPRRGSQMIIVCCIFALL